MSRVSNRSESLKYDVNSAGDIFGWYETIRGLNLSLMDAEDDHEWAKPHVDWLVPAMDDLKERGVEQRRRVEYWNHSIPNDLETNFGYELTELEMLRSQYRRLKDFYDFVKPMLDKAESTFDALELTPADDPDDDPQDQGYNTTHWNMVWSEWDTIYDWLLFNDHKVSLSYCAFLYDLLDTKLKRREITTYHFAKVGILLASKLNWKQEICRMSKLNKRLKGKPNQPGKPEARLVSYEDRFFGEMSFNEDTLVEAIDMRSAAKDIGCDVYVLMPAECTFEEGFNTYNEHTVLFEMLISNNWNKTATAKQMGVSRSTVYRRLKKAVAAAK